jgi:hypothetical protein
MTETESIPKTEAAALDPVKTIAGWEIFLRLALVLLGIFLGLVAGVVTAAAMGWFWIDC